MLVPVFANPYSGRRSNREHLELLQAALRAEGLTPQPLWNRDEAGAWLAAHGRGAHAIVSAGGDGTAAAVLGLLRDAGCPNLPFMQYPLGNENLIARHFGFGRQPRRMAAALRAGRTRRCDLGEVNGRPFLLMLGAGFDAEVAHRFDRWRRSPADGRLHRSSRAAYAPHIMGAVLGPVARVALLADGREYTGGFAVVCNLAEYAAGLSFNRGARDDDGLLDWAVFPYATRAGQMWTALKWLARGDAAKAGAHAGRSARVELRTLEGPPVPLQSDGDPAGHAPATVVCKPKALQVVCVD